MRSFVGRFRLLFLRWVHEPGVLSRVEIGSHGSAGSLQVILEVRSWLLFVIVIGVFTWYVASPSPVALMSLVTLAGLLLLSYLWARAMAYQVRGSRKLRFAAMQVGDELEEQIGLVNTSPFPVLWAEFDDRSNIPGYTVASARSADPYSSVNWRAHTICRQRGVFSLGPWELHLGEPFGVFSVRQTYLQRQDILVYPPLAELPEHILPHLGALGDHRSLNLPLAADTISSTSVRPYQPGDPLHQIHWRTTARHFSPFVKVFQPEAASKIWLVPDFNTAGHLGHGPDSTEEIMVTVVASLAAQFLQQNLAVGLFAVSNNDTVVVPRRGQAHLWEILQALAPLRLADGNGLADALDRVQALLTGNDLLLLVTPSLQLDWVRSLRRIARSYGGSGRAEVLLLDPLSFGGTERAENHLAFFIDQGIPASCVKREDVHLVSGYYGEISRWEFAVLGTGRVVARKTPRLAGSLFDSTQPGWKQPED